MTNVTLALRGIRGESAADIARRVLSITGSDKAALQALMLDDAELAQILTDAEAARDGAEADAVQTALDRIATAADRVQTGLDRVATAADVVAAEADRVATAADRVVTTADRVQTGLDRTQTGLDRVATAADRVQTGLDRVATAADVAAADADRVATAADRVVTTADRVQTGLDRTQTGLDRVATAADRVVTTADRVAAASSAAAASSTVSAVTTNARRARSFRSGKATVNSDGTINLSIGYSWIEANAGAAEATIAPIAGGAAIGVSQGYIVDILAGPVDGSGRRIPSLVTIASGAQAGWQTAGRHVLIAKDAQNNYFGEYTREFAASSPGLPLVSTLSSSGSSLGVRSRISEADQINFLMDKPVNLTGSVVGAIQPWCDVWHMDRIFRFAGGTSTTQYEDVGEMETVLVLGTGAYLGGSAHGYQVKSFAQVQCNGVAQTADGVVSGYQVNIIQVSDFLDPAKAGIGGFPNNAGDRLFRCNTEWVFKPDGRMTLRGYYECLVASTVTNISFIGMLKPVLSDGTGNVFTVAYPEGGWEEVDLVGAITAKSRKGKKCRYVSPGRGVWMEAEAVGSWADGPNWNMLLNASGPKAKLYFQPHGQVPKTWALGERQYFEIEYRFGVN